MKIGPGDMEIGEIGLDEALEDLVPVGIPDPSDAFSQESTDSGSGTDDPLGW